MDDAGLFARLAADEAAHYAIFRAAFAFLDPALTTDALCKPVDANGNVDPARIIPGAYPDLWSVKPVP